MAKRVVKTETWKEHTVSEKSRYRLARLHVDDLVAPGRLRYGLWRDPEISTENAILHTIKVHEIGRIDLLAYQYYGDCTYWWVLAWVNQIKNPLTDMVAGTVIKVPPITEVNAKLAEKGGKGETS